MTDFENNTMGSGDDYEGLEVGTYKCDSCGKPKFYLFKCEVKDELIGQAAYELWCKRCFFDNRKAAQKRNEE